MPNNAWFRLAVCLLVVSGSSLFFAGSLRAADSTEQGGSAQGLLHDSADVVIDESEHNSDELPRDNEYRIGPENVLSIRVYYGKEGEDLARKVKVSSDGKISFPLVEEVQVAGLTVSELQKKLTGLLQKDFFVNPQVSVFIEEYSSVSVTGEVANPGRYPLTGRMTLIEAITQAGGFSKIASPNNTKIIREVQGQKQVLKVRAYDILKKGQTEKDIELRPGDIVVIPESIF